MEPARKPSSGLIWLLLLVASLLVFYEGWLQIRAGNHVRDFFQDWASLRFWTEGTSLYAPLSAPAERLFGKGINWAEQHYGDINPHPPASLFPMLPCVFLPYSYAALGWNLASLCFLLLSLRIIWESL